MSKQELLSNGRQQLLTKSFSSKKIIDDRRPLYLLVGAIFILLFLFIVYPLFKVFWMSVYDDGFTLKNYLKFFSSSFNLKPLWNTLMLASSVAMLGTFIGYVFAYVVTRSRFVGKRFIKMFGTFPMISPPFVISLAAIILLGQNGTLTRNIITPIFGEGFSIYGFKGLLLVETMSYFPTAFLIFVGVFSAIDPVLEDAAHNMGASPSKTFREVIFPLTKPGIYSSLLLLFIESIADFGNPLVLSGGFKVLSVEAYLKITGEFDLPMGATISMVLLVPAMIAFFVQKYYVDKKSFVTLTGKSSTTSFFKSHSLITNIFLGSVIFVTMSMIILFYGAVVWGSFVKVWGADHTFTLSNYFTGVEDSWNYIKDTFILSAVATPLTGLMALVISYLIVRKKFVGKNIMEVTSMLSFAVPGTVVGIGYILAFNDSPFLLTGTSAIIIILFIFRNMPVGIRSSIASLKQLDPAIEEAAMNLGANTVTTLKDITAPLLAPAFFSGVAYSFVRCLTAISAIIFVVSGSWNLLTVSLLGQVENGHLSVACAICVLLILTAGSILGIMQFFIYRKGIKQRD